MIRGALAVVTADQADPRRRLPLFASGDPTLAERVDELDVSGEAEGR